MTITNGLIFSGKHFTGRIEVISIDEAANNLHVQLCLKTEDKFSIWNEFWDLQIVKWGFESGEYFLKEFKDYPSTFYNTKPPINGNHPATEKFPCELPDNIKCKQWCGHCFE